MVSTRRLLLINSILILLMIEVNGGYWICDWVGGRGWMYCSRGICNAFAGKRSILQENERDNSVQNEDGVYCLETDLCYSCRVINDHACRLMLEKQYDASSKSYRKAKRSNEDICS